MSQFHESYNKDEPSVVPERSGVEQSLVIFLLIGSRVGLRSGKSFALDSVAIHNQKLTTLSIYKGNGKII